MKLIMTCDKNDSNYKVLDYVHSIIPKGFCRIPVLKYAYYYAECKELVSADLHQLHLVKGFKAKGMKTGLYSIVKKGSSLILSKVESNEEYPRYKHVIPNWKKDKSYTTVTVVRGTITDNTNNNSLYCKIIRSMESNSIILYKYFIDAVKHIESGARFAVHINTKELAPVVVNAKIGNHNTMSLIMPIMVKN